MDIENELLREYYENIKKLSSINKELTVLPDTPKSFYSFPTIIFREVGNSDDINGKTTNNTEYVDYVMYQVDIYTKDIVIDGKEYNAREIIAEFKSLTSDFFRNRGFTRTSSTRGEYIDISVKRHVMTFSGRVQSWNRYIV